MRLPRAARPEGGLVHQIVVILAVSVLSGVLIAGLALPWVGLVKQGAESSAAAIEGFPLRLNFQPLNERTRVLDSRGNRLASFYDENRKYVTLDQISHKMTSAIVAIEDSRFYEHGAIDVKGTVRAFLVNRASADVVQGGSSITQQLVKLTRIDNANTDAQSAAASDDTIARKFEELRYAVWVEEHLSKDKILEHYLNAAYFGDGAYGIEAAAHHYFSTSAAQLNLAQSALLAGLVRNPSGYNPTIYRRDALDRRDTVVARMLDLHKITTRQAARATRTPLGLHVSAVPNGCVNTDAAWFCDYLLNYLLQDRSLGKTLEERKHLVYGGGLTITSTVDPRFQRAADTSVQTHVRAGDNAIGGLAMVEPGTGYVRALAQSRPMGSKEKRGETFLNYVVPTRYGDSNGFQAGSTFKAFVLAAAIKQGIPLNTTIYAPSTLLLPEGEFQTCGGKNYKSSQVWSVSNSTTSGSKNLYTGTRESVNTFYAQLEKMTGLCAPWRLADQMGIELEDASSFRVPSFTLGVADTSPLEMAEAYATFAARGKHCSATPVLEIRNRNGEILPTAGPDCSRIMKPAEADAVNDILKGVIAPEGFAAAQNLGRDAAGKTGTIQSTRAVWFVGYTPKLSTASMIAGANRVGSPITLLGQTVGGVYLSDASGSGTAAPMWGDAMRAILSILPSGSFVEPDPRIIKGQPVTIPSFGGSSPDSAAKRLTKLGFNPQLASTVSSSYAAGTVAYTSPSGQGVSGETVLIYISGGVPTPPPAPAPVPAPVPAPSPAPPPNDGGGGKPGDAGGGEVQPGGGDGPSDPGGGNPDPPGNPGGPGKPN